METLCGKPALRLEQSSVQQYRLWSSALCCYNGVKWPWRTTFTWKRVTLTGVELLEQAAAVHPQRSSKPHWKARTINCWFLEVREPGAVTSFPQAQVFFFLKMKTSWGGADENGEVCYNESSKITRKRTSQVLLEIQKVPGVLDCAVGCVCDNFQHFCDREIW